MTQGRGPRVKEGGPLAGKNTWPHNFSNRAVEPMNRQGSVLEENKEQKGQTAHFSIGGWMVRLFLVRAIEGEYHIIKCRCELSVFGVSS